MQGHAVHAAAPPYSASRSSPCRIGRLRWWLLLTVLLGGAAWSRGELQFSLERLDRFMQQIVAPSPLRVTIPVPMEYAPLLLDDGKSSYWMREADAAKATKQGQLPARAGYMVGKLSDEVRYDAAARHFVGIEDAAGGSALRARMRDLSLERLDHPTQPAILLSGREQDSGRWVFVLYLAMPEGSGVAQIEMHPKSNDRKVGDILWGSLRKSLLETGLKVLANRP